MTREDKLLAQLDATDIQDGGLHRARLATDLSPEDQRLQSLHTQLKALPRDIALSTHASARLRAQLIAAIQQPTPERGIKAWLAWLNPRPAYGSMLLRPVAAVLAVALAAGSVSASTVSAAMESIPGDGLYPVKTAVQQTRLALAFNDGDRADTYLWIANAKVDELSRAVDSGRIDAATTAKVVEDYQYSVAQALRLAASQKQAEERTQQQVDVVQTSLHQIYEKAPEAMQASIAQALSVNGGAAASSTSSSSVTTPPATTQGSANNVTAPVIPAPTIPDLSVEAPPARPIISGKGGTEPEAVPGKDGPLSLPPPQEPPSRDTLPPKGDVGPQAGPVSGKEGGPAPATNIGTDTKTEPVPAPAASETTPPASTVPPVPEGKDSPLSTPQPEAPKTVPQAVADPNPSPAGSGGKGLNGIATPIPMGDLGSIGGKR